MKLSDTIAPNLRRRTNSSTTLTGVIVCELQPGLIQDHRFWRQSNRFDSQTMKRCLDHVGSTIRSGDEIKVLPRGRIAVVIADLLTPRDALVVADRVYGLLSAILEPNRPRLGVTVDGPGPVNTQQLTRQAEQVLKGETVLNRFGEVFVPEQERRGRGAVAVGELERDLMRAIELDQIVCHFQPVVNLQTSEIQSLAALPRWRHPVRQLIHPSEFMPLAKRGGIMPRLGLRVIELAVRQHKLWLGKQVFDSVPITIAIDSGQWLEPGFGSEVSAILDRHQADPENFIFEVCPGSCSDSDLAVVMNGLRDLGVGLSFDLQCLHEGEDLEQWPAEVLSNVSSVKVAQSVDSSTEIGSGDTNFDRMVEWAHERGIPVHATDLNTDAAVARAVAAGVENGQGFVLGRPLSAQKVLTSVDGR